MSKKQQENMPKKTKTSHIIKNDESEPSEPKISEKQDIVSEKQNIVSGTNDLTTNDLFRLADLHFNKKNFIFRHLYDSYNKFIEEDVKNFLEFGENIFTETMTEKTYYRYRFKFTNIRVQEPLLDNGIEPMFPTNARHGNMTYSLKIFADVTQYQDVIDIITNDRKIVQVGETEANVPVSIIPDMLRSKWCNLTTHKGLDKKECDYDPGGYFIVNGNEKVIISQDRMVENKPLVFIKKDSGALSLIVQVNSRSYKPNGLIQIISIKMKKDKNMMMRVPILNEINVFILLRALGLETDKDIINYTVYDEFDVDMIDLARISLDNCKNEKGEKIRTQQEAIDYLITKLRVLRKYTETDKDTKIMQKKLHLMNLLQNSLLPHVEGDLLKKACYIAYMIHKLLKVSLGRAKIDDRDSYINKRIDLPGDLLFELYKQHFKKMLGECKKFFDSRNKDNAKPLNVIVYIKPNIIEQGLKASLSTGHWIRRQGVAQMLQRLTYLQTLAFLRRVDAPSGDASSSKLTGPRHLHPSSVGLLCCAQTPEHAKVGLTKHLAMIASISIMSRDQLFLLSDYLSDKLIKISDLPVNRLRDHNVYKVFLNGDWLGMTENYIKLEEEMIDMKLKGDFDQKNVSIVADHEECELKIYCDSGRLYRPVIRVENNVIKLKKHHIESISLNKADKINKITEWELFIMKNPDVIEYIDMELQPYIMIADKIKKVETQRKRLSESIDKVKDITSNHTDNRYDEMFYVKYTHCEIHPALLLGEISTNSPFCDHNPGPRWIFQYAQTRQAMGIFTTNYRNRLDISFILYNSQKPHVSTRTSKYTNSEILPAGENAIVAIATYTGYNQEDSLIFNKTSIERGKFRGMYLKKYIQSIQKNQSTSQDDIFMKPDPTKVMGMKHGSYDKLNDRGFVPEETVVVNGDVLMGKVTPISDTGNTGKMFKDSSEHYKMFAPGVVDRVYDNILNQDGYEILKMSVRSERIPRIGDKYCSRHGQKGTIGILLQGIDMPFTKEGIRPDIILNPNAIPSRMTIGQLVESLVGKASAIDGMDADGTSFEEHDIDSIKQKLKELGYEENGYEYLYNGMSGERMKTMIFIGPTFYQRLKHLVEDKIHSRSRGPRTLLTRQPPEGRSRDGGLRLGEMERDALCAHGLAKFIKEKLLDNSDAYATFVCDKCGLFAQRFNRKENKSHSSPDDIYYCPSCNNYNEISKIVIPYAFKLLVHELMAMCIAPRIRTVKDIYSS